MNRRVALPWRLRHDLYARIEDVVAGHDQARLATTEQLGEQFTKIFVHRIKCAFQQITRLFVDFHDRIFERGHRLNQVSRLRIQEALPLHGHIQLVQSGQVDCTQGIDLIVQTGDFTL